MPKIKQLNILFLFLCTLFLSACDNTDSGFPGPTCDPQHSPCFDLSYLMISPNKVSLLTGMTQQFNVYSIFTDGKKEDVSDQVKWSLSDPELAAIDKNGRLIAKKIGDVIVSAQYSGHLAKAQLTIIQGSLKTVNIVPSTQILSKGTSKQYNAFILLTDGRSIDITENSDWSVENKNIASVNEQALVSALEEGNTKIKVQFNNQASAQTLSASASLQVSNASVKSISISPDNGIYPVGKMGVYHAKANYSDGTTQDITRDVTWHSDDTGVVRIVESGINAGDAIASTIGLTDISLTFNSMSATTAVTVNDAVLKKINITPINKTTQLGNEVQYQAYGTYSDMHKYDITKQVQWVSDDTDIAKIDSNGSASTFKVGSTNISAIYQGVTKTTTLNVDDAILTSLQITPQNTKIAKGHSVQFEALATYSDDQTEVVSTLVNWSVSDSRIASIVPLGDHGGFAEALLVGETDVIATFKNIQVKTKFTVTSATLESVILSPKTAKLPVGVSQQYQLFALFSDKTSSLQTQHASYQSNDPSSVSINDEGLASVLTYSDAPIIITATYQDKQSTAALTTLDTTLDSLRITPEKLSMQVGQKNKLIAIAHYKNGNDINVTNLAAWSVSDDDVASIDNSADKSGTIVALKVGSTVVSATFSGATAINNTTVRKSPIRSIEIQPLNETLIVETTLQYKLIATYDDDSTEDVSKDAQWLSSNPDLASIDQIGLATAIKVGQVSIQASYQKLTENTSLSIRNVELTEIIVTPDDTTINATQHVFYNARGLYSDSSESDITKLATWTTGDTEIVSIVTSGEQGGLATPENIGDSYVQASFSGISSPEAQIHITAACTPNVQITPNNPNIRVGEKLTYTVTRSYPDCSLIDVTSESTLTSLQPDIANFIDANTIVAYQLGAVDIRATYLDFEVEQETLNVIE
ncbi:Ig domain-containing protein group 2 domain-containing protein [Psychromonas sp. CNPT3]|uniref:Ig-like domain-containing protein n=1 Tax=Psychromonas sp. CNPT3 TaxID=314282 RepID=UPI00006E76DD|nr:Ig-like domain-containing protein [Psychromonas sp. CNPT3]AGH80143.1 Ig domain-containing protein group 2 domain-containing protein [Psychromonas sp. CNPT3]